MVIDVIPPRHHIDQPLRPRKSARAVREIFTKHCKLAGGATRKTKKTYEEKNKDDVYDIFACEMVYIS